MSRTSPKYQGLIASTLHAFISLSECLPRQTPNRGVPLVHLPTSTMRGGSRNVNRCSIKNNKPVSGVHRAIARIATRCGTFHDVLGRSLRTRNLIICPGKYQLGSIDSLSDAYLSPNMPPVTALPQAVDRLHELHRLPVLDVFFRLPRLSERAYKGHTAFISPSSFSLLMLDFLVDSYIVVWILVRLLLSEPRDTPSDSIHRRKY